MVTLNWNNPPVTLLIGFCFGFVLERSGFGDSRRLAAQFYLYEMHVLKVMFTAIVTAMVLLFAGSALGLLDFEQLWVPPTHLGPAVIGGFALGVGFILGGYCPGTSLVSAATWKIDGMVFALGVAAGLFLFGLSAPGIAVFWDHAGFLGRLTWPDLLGIDAGLAVVAVVFMAIGVFLAVEWVERQFAPAGGQAAKPSPAIARVVRGAVVAGVFLSIVTALIGQPTPEKMIAWKSNSLERRLASREVFIAPGELYGLLTNNQIPLLLLDVRNQRDYNVFHLRDARRVSLDQLRDSWVKTIQPETVVVVMSNDEARAVEGWKYLAIRPNVNAYILAGGVNRWLDLYYARRTDVPAGDEPAQGNDVLRYRFPRALGDRVQWARPRSNVPAAANFVAKVKVAKPVRAEGGGCG